VASPRRTWGRRTSTCDADHSTVGAGRPGGQHSVASSLTTTRAVCRCAPATGRSPP